MRTWHPGKDLKRVAALYQRRVAEKIRAARPPEEGGRTGGSLPAQARRSSLLRLERWGVVVQWSQLGDKLTFFLRGTSRGQRPRPVVLKPDRAPAAQAVIQSARKHFGELDRRAAQ